MHKICLILWTFPGHNILISFMLIKICAFYKHWYMTSWIKSRSQFTMFLLTFSNFWCGRLQVFCRLTVLINLAKLQENTCTRAFFQQCFKLSPIILLNKDSTAEVFSWIWQYFYEKVLCRALCTIASATFLKIVLVD